MIQDENDRSNNTMAEASSTAKPVAAKKGKAKSVEEIYTKKTQLEHILLRPDSYIGSIEKLNQQMWVYEAESNQIVNKQITFVPGLYKIFDEIIVNAADNKQRDPSMNRIEVTIKPEENSIRVWNNGNGIPVVVHQEHKIYIPELIFGNLLTGSNFDDGEEKTTGGRNGYGAKLANIFSTKFVVETADKSRGLKYHQEFSNNMTKTGTPKITKHSGADYTCITFYPDLARFNMTELDEDTVALLSKRVFDVAGTNTASGPRLGVFLNGTRVEAKSFEQYIEMYSGLEPAIAFEKINDRWEIGVGVSDGSFQQVSFANSICTTKGGVHVNYIADQITSKIAAAVKKKNKGEEVKANQIKNHLTVFVNALIVNPSFDSQTKENLTTKMSAFGSTCTVSDKMIKKIEKSQIIDNVLSWSKFKQNKELAKKGGSKRSKIMGITKLDDANCAGTSKSSNCTLILTEGDSAKALAISGLGVVGRDYYGVFPLKGKLLNVREAAHAQIMKNDEIQNIAKILGLTFGKKYDESSIKDLRYGHLMIMTDQDHDGSHIKGLLINFIHHFWPSLLKIDGFLQQFITPIVKCTKGKKEVSFYTIPEYEEWKEANGEGKGWKIKYYKGLGTSTAAEAKEYFSNINQHEIPFQWDDRASDMIDMAFAKKRVDDRKLWLLNMEAGTHMDYKVDHVSYDTFINRELILFSNADNCRSIPHFMDGLKPSQRKVLYSCFKRNLKNEIKVAQLAGYVSEHSAYHHGEASLTQTIIGMAQDFVGSNNINFLTPCGQFGTRLMGGKDAASPRYVFTKLEAVTRCIFHPDDDALLDYLDDDGQSIEPTFYVPVIPMALVNGSEGIGTGWSCSVPQYNPRTIISILREMIHSQTPSDNLTPWYRGFTGSIVPKAGAPNNFSVYGTIDQLDDTTVLISELPVGRWTTDHKQFLESCVIGATTAEGPTVNPFIKDFKENHTDTTVSFSISVPAEKLESIVNDEKNGGLSKKFKLEGSISTTNMHMFDLNSQIRKYDGPMAVLNDFYQVRIQFYDRRKAHLIERLTEEFERLDNRMRFVLDVIENRLVISNRKKGDLLNELSSRGFKTFDEKKTNNTASAAANDGNESDNQSQLSSLSEAALDPLQKLGKGYDYLLSMKLWNLTMEKVEEMKRQREEKRTELDILIAKPPEKLWLDDLDALEEALSIMDMNEAEARASAAAARKKANANRNANGSKKPRAKQPVKKAARKSMDSDDDEDEDDFDDDDSDFEVKPKKAIAVKAKVVKSSSSSSSSAISKTSSTTTARAPMGATSSSSMSFAPPTVVPKVAAKAPVAKKAAAAASSSPASSEVSAYRVPVPSTQDTTTTGGGGGGSTTMSLFARIKAQQAAKQAGLSPPPPVVVAVPAPTKTFGGGASYKKSKIADDEGEDDFPASQTSTVTASSAPRPGRAAAQAPKVYTVDDSDDNEEEEAAISLDDESPVKSKPKAKAGVKRPTTSSKKSAASDATPTKGNSGTKFKSLAAKADDTFSASDTSPMPMKKAKANSGKAAPAKKKVPAAAAAAASKKKGKIADSEDEEEEEEEVTFSDASPVAAKARPVRARKQVVYNVDSEDEEDEEEASFDDDDDDDDEFSD